MIGGAYNLHLLFFDFVTHSHVVRKLAMQVIRRFFVSCKFRDAIPFVAKVIRDFLHFVTFVFAIVKKILQVVSTRIIVKFNLSHFFVLLSCFRLFLFCFGSAFLIRRLPSVNGRITSSDNDTRTFLASLSLYAFVLFSYSVLSLHKHFTMQYDFPFVLRRFIY